MCAAAIETLIHIERRLWGAQCMGNWVLLCHNRKLLMGPMTLREEWVECICE